jgi:hypothetical protein
MLLAMAGCRVIGALGPHNPRLSRSRSRQEHPANDPRLACGMAAGAAHDEFGQGDSRVPVPGGGHHRGGGSGGGRRRSPDPPPRAPRTHTSEERASSCGVAGARDRWSPQRAPPSLRGLGPGLVIGLRKLRAYVGQFQVGPACSCSPETCRAAFYIRVLYAGRVGVHAGGLQLSAGGPRISWRASRASGAMGHVRRPPHLRLCRVLPALVSLLFPPLLPLLPILLPLILALGCCILILLLLPIRPMH